MSEFARSTHRGVTAFADSGRNAVEIIETFASTRAIRPVGQLVARRFTVVDQRESEPRNHSPKLFMGLKSCLVSINVLRTLDGLPKAVHHRWPHFQQPAASSSGPLRQHISRDSALGNIDRVSKTANCGHGIDFRIERYVSFEVRIGVRWVPRSVPTNELDHLNTCRHCSEVKSPPERLQTLPISGATSVSSSPRGGKLATFVRRR